METINKVFYSWILDIQWTRASTTASVNLSPPMFLECILHQQLLLPGLPV